MPTESKNASGIERGCASCDQLFSVVPILPEIIKNVAVRGTYFSSGKFHRQQNHNKIQWKMIALEILSLLSVLTLSTAMNSCESVCVHNIHQVFGGGEQDWVTLIFESPKN